MALPEPALAGTRRPADSDDAGSTGRPNLKTADEWYLDKTAWPPKKAKAEKQPGVQGWYHNAQPVGMLASLWLTIRPLL